MSQEITANMQGHAKIHSLPENASGAPDLHLYMLMVTMQMIQLGQNAREEHRKFRFDMRYNLVDRVEELARSIISGAKTHLGLGIASSMLAVLSGATTGFGAYTFSALFPSLASAPAAGRLDSQSLSSMVSTFFNASSGMLDKTSSVLQSCGYSKKQRNQQLVDLAHKDYDHETRVMEEQMQLIQRFTDLAQKQMHTSAQTQSASAMRSGN